MDARAAKERDPVQGDRRRRLLVGVDEGRAVRAATRSSTWPSARATSRASASSSRPGGEVPRGHFSTFDEFAGDLPMRRERPFQAWLQISMGCNSTCSYCIVPSVRGREQSRPARRARGRGRALRGRRRARADAARPERQLVGPRPARGRARGFGELLRLLDAVPGIERIRYTSPHPKDMRDDVDRRASRVRVGLRARPPAAAVGLDAHPASAMRRTYSRERYVALARAPARGGAGARADDRHHRRLPRRDRGRLRARRSRSATRSGSTTRSRSSTRRAAARMPRAWTSRCRGRQARAARAARRGRPAPRRTRATRRSSGRCRRCSSRAPRAPIPDVLRGRTRTNKTVLLSDAEPGELVQVRIEAATSQTLRGVRERVAASTV